MKTWEARCASQEFFSTGEGKSAPDSAWRTAVVSATQTQQGNHYLESNVGFRRCFEHVQYIAPARAAGCHSYPIGVLLVSVASYAWARSLADRFCIARPVYSGGVGVIVGSPFATAELKCVALTALLAMRLSHRQVGLTLYVDDLSLACAGPVLG